MSELARTLIADAQADCDTRLAAIEAATGLIEEAETLAATLRHHGIDCKAYGYSSPRWFNDPEKCVTWVKAHFADGPQILAALGAADLRIGSFTPSEHSGIINLCGIATPLHVPKTTVDELIATLARTMFSLVGTRQPDEPSTTEAAHA